MPKPLAWTAAGALGLAVMFVFLAQEPRDDAPEPPPNILLIMADDLGNNDIGSFGDGSMRTPNIDQLASEGVRFRAHYADATCRPARVALLTGMDARSVVSPPDFRGISPEFTTLPEALKRRGYQTQHIGKWHISDLIPSGQPHHHGFDHWLGFASALSLKRGDMLQPGSTYYNPYLQQDGEEPVKHEGHLTEILTDAAIGALENLGQADKPWFVNLWYFAPHGPLQPAAEFAERYDSSKAGRYLALVEQLDHAVGRLLAALEASGQAENTVVLFLSDNGGTNNTRDSNWPFIGAKTEYLEGGLRTPLVIRHAGLEPTDIDAPVFISDLMPTLLSYAGMQPPPTLEGRNLRPLLRGRSLEPVERRVWNLLTRDYINWGILDRSAGQLSNMARIQDWDAANGRFEPPREASADEKARLGKEYDEWSRTKLFVPLKTQARKQGRMAYLGDSYRRTPGYGRWTLQLPLQLASTKPITLKQPGQFSLKAGQGQLAIALPDHRLRTSLPSEGCALLSVVSHYLWKLRRPEESTAQLWVYLDDELIYQQEYPISRRVMVDNYPPLVASAGASTPRIYNDLFLSDFQARYGAELTCEPARAEAS
ncbi:MAG: sulfatase-like hydrolase/transferase [Pseudomonadota bacterium]